MKPWHENESVVKYLTHSRNLYEKVLNKYDICFEDRSISIFNGRVVLPLRDFKGNVLGYQSRLYKKEDAQKSPKYLISKGFEKSEYVYGLYELLASGQISKTHYLIWTEGNFNVLALDQEGFCAVCTMGASVSHAQGFILKCVTDNILYLKDADSAGDKHFSKNIGIMEESGLNVRPITLPRGFNDYNDILSKGTDKDLKKFNYILNNESDYF